MNINIIAIKILHIKIQIMVKNLVYANVKFYLLNMKMNIIKLIIIEMHV